MCSVLGGNWSGRCFDLFFWWVVKCRKVAIINVEATGARSRAVCSQTKALLSQVGARAL
jgi:hypothetical protein